MQIHFMHVPTPRGSLLGNIGGRARSGAVTPARGLSGLSPILGSLGMRIRFKNFKL